MNNATRTAFFGLLVACAVTYLLFSFFSMEAPSSREDAVAEDPLPPEMNRLFEICLATEDPHRRTASFGSYFQSLTKLRSAEIAIARAQELKHQGALDDCHIIAHYVGEANLDKHDSDLGKALATCPTGCLHGCIHGAVQTYVSRKDSFESFIAELDHVCDVVQHDARLQRQCIHGVGHGFLTGNFLPLGAALAACRKFGTKHEETCLGGVFMENMRQYVELSPDELTKAIPDICRDAVSTNDATHTRLCVDSIGEGLMFHTGHDLRRSLESCDRVAHAHRDVCKRAAIAEARHAPHRFDVTACDHAPAQYRNWCGNLLDGRE